jgi:hypothetical protein
VNEPKDQDHTIGRIEIKVTCHYGMWKVFVKDHKETISFPLMNCDEEEAKARGALLADMIRKEMDRVQGLT